MQGGYLQEISSPPSQASSKREDSSISKIFAMAVPHCHFIILLNEEFISEQGDLFVLLVAFRGQEVHHFQGRTAPPLLTAPAKDNKPAHQYAPVGQEDQYGGFQQGSAH